MSCLKGPKYVAAQEAPHDRGMTVTFIVVERGLDTTINAINTVTSAVYRRVLTVVDIGATRPSITISHLFVTLTAGRFALH